VCVRQCWRQVLGTSRVAVCCPAQSLVTQCAVHGEMTAVWGLQAAAPFMYSRVLPLRALMLLLSAPVFPAFRVLLEHVSPCCLLCPLFLPASARSCLLLLCGRSQHRAAAKCSTEDAGAASIMHCRVCGSDRARAVTGVRVWGPAQPVLLQLQQKWRVLYHMCQCVPLGSACQQHLGLSAASSGLRSFTILVFLRWRYKT
jgi:hypothetical protein